MPNHNENGLLQLPPNIVVQKFGNPTKPEGETASHHRTYSKLFSQPPSRADVAQGGIGDCYLISALNSILNCPGGPKAIEECFLDRSSGGLSGEVVMRLFDQNCAPQFISTSKKVVTGLGAKHTIWVKLFEKGYASLFFGGAYSKLGSAAGAAHGKGSDVLRAVLGANAEVLGCSKNDSTFEKLIAPGKGANAKKAIQHVFNDNEDLVDEWGVWMRGKFPDWLNIVKESTCYRLEDWQAFMDGPGRDMPEKFRTALQTWMLTASPLPGRRGTGLYTAAQKRLYDGIASALSKKKAVNCGTNQSVAGTAKIMGKGSAGEGKAASGLVGGHAYSILDAKSEDGLLWVKLENPWKEWGVKYEKGVYKTGPKAGRAYLKPSYDANVGDFWLELCDLTKHFKHVFVAGVALQ